jgi:hypothetical protein
MPVAKCKDCDTVLLGRWCHACGQDSREPLRDVRDFAAEFADAAYNFDGKLMRSLRLLATRPGELTLAYWAGQRSRWTTPLRLYLLISFVVFLLYTFVLVRIESTAMTVVARLLPVSASEVQQRLPLLMFLYMPVFALFLRVLHAARGRLYLEHLMFALHYHAFAFLTQGLGILLAWPVLALGAPLPLVSVISVAAHSANAAWLVLGLKRVYGYGWPGTVLRFLLLSAAYGALLFGSLYLLYS